MKRAVITGLGIASCIGLDTTSVLESLREGKSGIRFREDYKEIGLRSHVAGTIDIDFKDYIDRKQLRFMGDAAGYAYISMQQAIEDSGLEESDVSNEMTGLIVGTGAGSPQMQYDAISTFESRGIKAVSSLTIFEPSFTEENSSELELKTIENILTANFFPEKSYILKVKGKGFLGFRICKDCKQ